MLVFPEVISFFFLLAHVSAVPLGKSPDSSQGMTVFSNAEEGRQLIVSNTEFAFDLFKELSAEKNGDNVFFSPISVSMALAMVYVGARSRTAEQMSEVLKFSSVHPDHLHSSFSELRQALVGSGNFTLDIANKLYGARDYSFLQDFLDATRNYYGAQLEKTDFAGEPEESRNLINQWVESQTNGKIKDLIPVGSLGAWTSLVLVNAIYFKGDWDMQFDVADTEEADFTKEDGSQVTVPMMYMMEKLNFGISHELNNVKALELPYVEKKLSMVVLLPEHPEGIDALESNLTSEHVVDLEETFQLRNVEVQTYLPRFKLEDSFDLRETLVDLGMEDAFGAADFSGMDGTRGLRISKIIHKSFLEVNEEGGEAAAATAVFMGESGSIGGGPRPLSFRADHPFLFFIRDNETKAILFLGKYSCPADA